MCNLSLPSLCWCLTVTCAPVESSSWEWMLDPIGKEGKVGLQEWCCVAQRRSWLSDCEGPLLGRSLKASIGQLTSALPSLQSKWLLTLSWCPVSLWGPRLVPWDNCRLRSGCTSPQDLRATAMLFLGQGSVVEHQACGSLLCCYFRTPVSVTHSHTEQVGRGLHGCGHLATRLSLLWP